MDYGTGLIPAGAGQTASDTSPSAAMRAHPRRCGADKNFVPFVPKSLGSSPQVRGRPLPTSDVALIRRGKEPTLSSH